MTVAAIHQPQYLPYLGFFHKLANCDVFVVLDNVQFHRRGLQHRNKIKTSTGWQWLTVPVTGPSHQLINEVRINPTEPWRRRHSNALRWNYGRAPYYRDYGPAILELLARPWDGLSALNMALLRVVMGALGIDRPVIFSSDLNVPGERSDLLINLCRAVGASSYLSGPGGRRYMELAAFERAGIEVTWQQFRYPAYPQVFSDVGFIPDLSIVDVLFSCGPKTMAYLDGA